MASTLQRLVEADRGDFQSRTKLRLLRVCKTFCVPGICWQLGIAVDTLTVVEKLLWVILGDGQREKCNLFTLLKSSSPVAQCQSSLLSLLQHWGGVEAWAVFRIVGGKFDEVACRRWARAQTLQLPASVFEYFELAMSSPPHSLIKLCDPDVSAAVKTQAAKNFLAPTQHLHCLSLFCRRLRARCPTMRQMLSTGSHIVRAWSLTAFVAIDFSERAHAQMRSDFSSSGRARSCTLSANRMLCQQVRAAALSRRSLPGTCRSWIRQAAALAIAWFPMLRPVASATAFAEATPGLSIIIAKCRCTRIRMLQTDL